ncbi:BadF/BadG/BcrA/BcrD ATPase family protein [Roseobacter sp. S98]|uniref:BadF/BadG/BcrA/BcrD ATPase family protein n=1 Tax=Roseobacter algicola (ex Choi et al. 2025) (nom. illeg.) TaxID=3092138 RepID=UPI0035C7298D
MDLRHTRQALAIDGGGTHCRVALVADGTVTSVETGPANVSTDFSGGVREILSGIDALAKRTGISMDSISDTPAFVGLAGVTGPEIADRIRAALPFRTIRTDDDRPAALRGALGVGDGFLVHCGTGSFFGVQQDRAARFAGGWGPVLGDEASAQWIGRLALSATLDTTDGIAGDSALTNELLAHFGDAAGIVRFAREAAPADLGELAKLVTSAAADGDENGLRVMRKGAEHIAQKLTDLGWHADMPVCLTGGIGPFFARHLPEQMRHCITAPKSTPLEGALSLAMDLASEVTA